MPTASIHEFPMKDYPDPREQDVASKPSAESLDAAIDTSNIERLRARRTCHTVTPLLPSPTDKEPFDRAAAMAIVEDLIHKWGAKRIASWVRNIAAINGEEV